MNRKKHFIEALTLVIAAALCAIVANTLAARDRRMALAGNYPDALRVPSQNASPTQATATTTRWDTTANEVANSTAPGSVATASTATEPATVVSPSRAALPNPATSAPAPATPARSPAGARGASTPPAAARSAAAASLQPAPVASPAAPAATSTEALAGKFAPHEKQPYVEIHGDDVALLHSRGALFLDARRTSVYEAGHIARAQPYSVWEADVDQKVNKLYETRGQDPKLAAEPIVIYCSGGDCEDSHMLAQKLWGVQFNNVYVYKDGFPDWEKRGGSVHKGSAP